MRNVVITGIPRSGTTLAAALLDSADDAVCLSEPPCTLELQDSCESAEIFCEGLVNSFEMIKAKLLRGEPVIDRRKQDGGPTTNYFETGQGQRHAKFVEVPRVSTNLSPNFILGIKHNALFASVLPEIRSRKELFTLAIIRDPVAVLASWNTLNLPVSRGCLPAADKFWPELNVKAAGRPSLLRSQVSLYNSLVERFMASGVNLVRYEDLVQDPKAFLRLATGRPSVGLRTNIPIAPRGPGAVELHIERKIRAAIDAEIAEGGATALSELYGFYRRP